MRALATCSGGHRVLERDNEDKMPAAIHAKHRLGRYPVLAPGDRDDAYRRLWEWILDGAHRTWRINQARLLLGPGARERIFEGRPDLVAWMAGVLARNPRAGVWPRDVARPGCVVAKSIHAQLALEWLDDEFDLDMVVLLRHPANVLASWLELKVKDTRNSTLETRTDIRQRYVDRWGVRLPGPDPLEQQCWRIGLLVAAMEEAAARHPTWHVRTHEDLCDDPPAKFRALFEEIGLTWTAESDAYLTAHDTEGEGFDDNRLASEIGRSWQHRLDDHQVATLRRVLGWFPITTWTDADYRRTG
jgi:hypothetical protein